MKKIILYLIIMIFILSGCSSDRLSDIKLDLEKVCKEPQNAEMLIDSAFADLAQALQQEDIAADKIRELSTGIKIIENSESRIIQYTQPPEVFGNSGKSSWQLFQYKPQKLAFVIEKNVPLDIQAYRIIKEDNVDYLYTYCVNYEVNIHRISIKRSKIGKDGLIPEMVTMEINNNDALWGYDKTSNTIYSRTGYTLSINNVSENGKIVSIGGIRADTNGQIELKLRLSEHGIYELE
ncbi:MAG: hypothetical protein ACOYVK_10430 [Bacillota bacterium]